MWLQKIIELFGKDIPLVLFAPYGFRLNQQCNSRRWRTGIHHPQPPLHQTIARLRPRTRQYHIAFANAPHSMCYLENESLRILGV